MHLKSKSFRNWMSWGFSGISTKHKLDTFQINCIQRSTACSISCWVTSLFLSQYLRQSGHWVKEGCRELSLHKGEKCGWKSVGIARCYVNVSSILERSILPFDLFVFSWTSLNVRIYSCFFFPGNKMLQKYAHIFWNIQLITENLTMVNKQPSQWR